MTAIYLDSNMVPVALRGSYSGKMFKARVCEEMTIPSDAGIWGGGSRNTYRVVRLADGATIEPVNHNAAPWNAARRDILVKLEPGIAVIESSMFCGKDMGLTFYVHPDNATKLLPAPAAELTPFEKLILTATKSLKASYMGKDRYQMAMSEYDCKKLLDGAQYPTREQWEATKAGLIARGLLNKAGAITNAGRNAIPSRY